MTIRTRHIVLGMLTAVVCCLPAARPRGTRTFPDPQPVRVLFAGDVMQHLPQVAAARRDTTFDYTPVFESVSPLFHAADLVVVNLETTLTRSRNYTGYPCFRSPAALAGALREAGVDVAVTANNHCCDGGAEGIRTTAEELDRNGILRTGAFADSLDRAGNNPLRLTRHGVRFALFSYTYGTNGIPVPRGMSVNLIDTLRMAADLTAARTAGVDCIAVCMHWGNEYERRENASQRNVTAFLKRHGADLVIGSHPHVVQPIEADSTHAVVYSLGNFVSNQRKRYSDGGIMAAVEIVKHLSGRMTYRLEIIPVWVALPGYRIVPPGVADTMVLPSAYRVFREDTAGLLGLAL